MNIRHLPSHLLLAGALAAATLPLARAEETTSHIAFSDPSKPGTIKIRAWRGDITVHGGDVSDITVRSDSVAATPTPRSDGLRVLSSTSAYGLSERSNTVTLEYGPGEGGGSADFDITVPRSTSVVVSNSANGSLHIAGISGDIDLRTLKGDVDLEDISGGALVETMKGDINVKAKALTASRPLSFSSMHGNVTIVLPVDAKANVRFRTHHGVILSNFDEKALVTRTEIAPRHALSPDAPPPVPPKNSPDAPPAVPTVNPPATPQEPKNLAAADSDTNDDWHANLRDAVREGTEAAAEAAREAAIAVQDGMSELRIELSTNGMAVPPMTGGKVVVGTLNGGGVEIQAASLTGDIVLKKAQ